LNLKDKISLKLFARYHAIDIHIKFCVWLQTGSGMAKSPPF
jgi:hypothetical protein